jgi:hypothetical protein
LKRIFPLFLFLIFSSSLVNAITCEPQQTIKFSDGNQGCMPSYSFFKQNFGNKTSPMITFANEKGKIAIAFSKDFKACPLATIDWAMSWPKALDTCNFRIKQLAKVEKINPSNCECETLIEDGVTKYNKQEFGKKIDEYIATRSMIQSALAQVPTKHPELISLLTTNIPSTVRCEPQQTIKFADGGEGCMPSYSFFKQNFDNKTSPMITFANEKGKIAIAFSKDFKACPLATINWADNDLKALEICNGRIVDRAKELKINPNNCQCEALINGGVTKLSKFEFERRIDNYIAVRTAALLGKDFAKNITSLPVQNSNSIPEKTSVQTARSVYALVIGNGKYINAGLVNPTNDANEIAKRFTQYGFTVKVILDGDRKTLIKALGDFQAQSVNYETNILFYAGHGIQYNGINYIIPTDMSLEAGSASIDFDAISTNQIVDKYMRGKTKLVFLDACRDNPLARSFMASRGLGAVSKGLAPMDVASGTLISYATKDGNVAVDGDGKNSPYTEALLKHLDRREDISLILRKVRQDVMNKTKGLQVPWDYGSLVGGQLILSNK